MSTNLQQFIESEKIRLERFSEWYRAMSEKEPEKYPISFEEDNVGMWFDMFSDFDENSEYYQL